jgi:hypothetical protein
MYKTGVKEAVDGKYYVTTYGTTLHVDRRCQYPYHHERFVWPDSTRTLSFRIHRGDKLRGPNGRLITGLCWDCTVDHEERAELKASQIAMLDLVRSA